MPWYEHFAKYAGIDPNDLIIQKTLAATFLATEEYRNSQMSCMELLSYSKLQLLPPEWD